MQLTFREQNTEFETIHFVTSQNNDATNSGYYNTAREKTVYVNPPIKHGRLI